MVIFLEFPIISLVESYGLITKFLPKIFSPSLIKNFLKIVLYDQIRILSIIIFKVIIILFNFKYFGIVSYLPSYCSQDTEHSYEKCKFRSRLDSILLCDKKSRSNPSFHNNLCTVILLSHTDILCLN